jgi:hypothetical protein
MTIGGSEIQLFNISAFSDVDPSVRVTALSSVSGCPAKNALIVILYAAIFIEIKRRIASS